jgi:hypothetical protein
MVKRPDQLPTDPPEPEHLPGGAPPPHAAPLPTLPTLTWEDYIDRRRQLEAQLVALAAQWAASPVWPRWLYRAGQLPRIVGSRAEAAALGPGWQVTPVS